MTKYLDIAYEIFLLHKFQDILPKTYYMRSYTSLSTTWSKLRDKMTWNQVKFTKFALENMSYAFLNT